MLTNARMQRIRIIVLKRDVDAVTETLGRLGALELTAPAEEVKAPVETAPFEEEMIRCTELQHRLGTLMTGLGVPRAEPQEEGEVPRLDFDEVSRLLSEIEEKAAGPQRLWDELTTQTKQALDTMDRIAPYRELNILPRQLTDASFLHPMIGDMPEDEIEPARAELPPDAMLVRIGFAAPPSTTQTSATSKVLGLSSRVSRFAMQTILENHQFRASELPGEPDVAPSAVFEKARATAASLEEQSAVVKRDLLAVGEEYRDELQETWLKAHNETEIVEAKVKFVATWAATVISGWAPARQVPALRDAVDKVGERKAIFEASDATADDIAQERVPSCAVLPKWLKPFQGAVAAYGEAGYREVEPTLMFAVTFLLMFGLIFGDLGQGACLLVIGLLVRRFVGKEMKDLGYVMACAGASSMIFGAFFQGAFFGHGLKEMGWPLTLSFEPLYFRDGETHEKVVSYLVMALALGVALISFGLVLNIVNRIRARDYVDLFLSRFGVAGIVFYWGTLALAAKMIVMGSRPIDLWLAILVIPVPLILLALHEPIKALLTGAENLWHENPMTGLLEGVIEALETIMLYTANTVSFLRVAAFALSHAGMSITIFVLQREVERQPGGPIWSQIIFVLGTAGIIGLEGLIVAIQILRLEYYEFFSKFFRGEGKRFTPFRLGGATQRS